MPSLYENNLDKTPFSMEMNGNGGHNPMAVSSRVVPLMDAVVKVFCVSSKPNYSLPRQRKRQCSSLSSGFVIAGRRVLTNAHSVAHYTQVKLKKRGSDTKYLATVLAVGTECDIALLTVKDDEFWEGVSPVEFGELPSLQDAVTVMGYPIGGDTISVTGGVVSRREILSYAHGGSELLGLQVDAAINSGNSGGPAFCDKGNCVGIAFQSMKQEDAENIGYVIPTPVIDHFIQDCERNKAYTGFPILGFEWQKMENPDLRISMGMKPDQKGILVTRVEVTAPESGVLESSDVILSFDGVDIGNDGTGEDEEERRVLRQQLATFQAEGGIFRTLSAKVDAVTMSPISWWSTYGAETPELAEIAVKVLSQPITSSSAERVWSTYSYIHNIKRNRLNYLRADKLVFIHTNIRLISRFTASYKDGPYRKWDVNPETTYLDDSATRLEDSRWREGLDSLEGGDDVQIRYLNLRGNDSQTPS